MQYCPRCGNRIAGTRFCGVCGEPVDAVGVADTGASDDTSVDEPPPASGVDETRIAAASPAHDTALAPVVAPVAVVSAATPKRSIARTAVPVGAGLVAGLLVMGGVAAWFLPSASTPPEAPQTQAPPVVSDATATASASTPTASTDAARASVTPSATVATVEPAAPTVTVTATAAVAADGLSGDPADVVNAAAVQDRVESEIARVVPYASAVVDCPPNVIFRAGATFTCGAFVNGQRAVITVTQTDASGGVSFESQQAFLFQDKAQRAVNDFVTGKVPGTWSTSYAMPGVQGGVYVATPKTTFTCDVTGTTAAGESQSGVATVTEDDNQGNVSIRVN